MIPQATKRQKLHEYLNKEKLYTKSYEDFDKQFSDEGARDELYNGLLETGDYTKSREDFETQYFPDLKKKDDTQLTPQLGQVDFQEPFPGSEESLKPSSEEATPENPSNLVDNPLAEKFLDLNKNSLSVEEQYAKRITDRKNERELREGLGVDEYSGDKNYIGTAAGSFNQAFVDVVASVPKLGALARKGIDEIGAEYS